MSNDHLAVTAHLGGRDTSGIKVAAGEHHPRPVAGELLRGVESDAGIGSGHHRDAPA